MSVVCETIEPMPNRDSLEWLRAIEKAAASPIRFVKGRGAMKRTMQVELDPWGNVCLQDFRWNFKRIMFSPFRASRGKRIWRYAGFITQRGINVLEPLLFLEVKKAFFVTRTMIVTPWMEEKIDLATIVMSEELQGNYNAGDLLDQAVDMISGLHDLKFLHGDLKWSNFFMTTDDPHRLFLTDLDGLRRSTSIVMQGRDYARFVLSALTCWPSRTCKETLIRRYLDHRNSAPRLLESSLRWHISRKEKRYRSK
jgi:tRNA A-37 threonylcarbamoyl transferase component Bud32